MLLKRSVRPRVCGIFTYRLRLRQRRCVAKSLCSAACREPRRSVDACPWQPTARTRWTTSIEPWRRAPAESLATRGTETAARRRRPPWTTRYHTQCRTAKGRSSSAIIIIIIIGASGQWISTKGRIACRAVIEDWVRVRVSVNPNQMCRYVFMYWCINLFICTAARVSNKLTHLLTYSAGETSNAFQWAGQPQKLPILVGISAPSNTSFLEPS